ncbi:hypothetical protein L1049_004329 [Liquidambar formosana]|uniref:Uncharacterized protein n=1 Tax=Liquidambar formosana TaxID=63359 RepID=A0AAP0RN38_LIQFO
MEISSDQMSHQHLPKRKKGGLITMPFIIANEAFEKVASYGLLPNMILYLMGDYYMGLAKGTNILFFWSAATNFMPLVGAFLADSYLGRFLTIGLGSIASLLGMVLLWLTAMIPQFKPPPCNQSTNSCKSPTLAQLTLLISSFSLMSIGAGGIRPCSLAFGADQLDKRDNPKNERVLESFFGWYYASAAISVVIALTGIVYIQDHMGWKVGFGVPAILMFLSAFLFFFASPLYVKHKVGKSLFAGFVQVIVVAYKNRKLAFPPRNSKGWYHHTGPELVMPTDKLSFLQRRIDVSCFYSAVHRNLGRLVLPINFCGHKLNEAFEKVASYGLLPNMIFYLIGDYNMGLAKGTNILFYWSAATNFMPLVGAFLADSYLGRFLTIGLGSIASLLGMVLLWLTAMIPQVKPPPCDHLINNCKSPTFAQLTVLISSFGLMSTGAGGIRPCSLAFGADQWDKRDNPKNIRILESFFSWYYVSATVSVLIALTGIVYLQDHKGWKKATKSLFVGYAQVIAVAYKNRKLPLPAGNSIEWYHHKKDSELIMPTDKLRMMCSRKLKCKRGQRVISLEKQMELSADQMSRQLVPRAQRGGLITLPFIIANEAFEKVASYGLLPNMIMYLMRDYKMGVTKGSNILFFWLAATNFMPLVGAFLADSYLGRFLTIGLGSIASLLGMVLLWLTAMIPQVKPPPCNQTTNSCKSPTLAQLTPLISSFALMSIGAGCIRPCSFAVGADQLDKRDDPKNKRVLGSFFGWYYASSAVSVLIALFIQDHMGSKVGFGVPAILMFFSAFSFFLASSSYVKQKSSKSLFTGFAQVIVVAYKNRKLALPIRNSNGLYQHKKNSELVLPTNKRRYHHIIIVINHQDFARVVH